MYASVVLPLYHRAHTHTHTAHLAVEPDGPVNSFLFRPLALISCSAVLPMKTAGWRQGERCLCVCVLYLNIAFIKEYRCVGDLGYWLHGHNFITSKHKPQVSIWTPLLEHIDSGWLVRANVYLVEIDEVVQTSFQRVGVTVHLMRQKHQSNIHKQLKKVCVCVCARVPLRPSLWSLSPVVVMTWRRYQSCRCPRPLLLPW